MFFSGKPKADSAAPKGVRHAGVHLIPGEVIDVGGVRFRLKLNARARRISLRIDNKTGEAVVTAPRMRDLPQAYDFALTRREWVLEKTRDITPAQNFRPGQTLNLNGLTVALTHSGTMAAARLSAAGYERTLSAGGEGEAYHRRIERFLRREAQKVAEAHITRYAAVLGVDSVRVTLFDAKGRWGSCTPMRRTIRLSWRLMLAPPSVFDYVCAHEAAHLRHPDHSPRFWAEVERLFGDYRPARKWLKDEGLSLYAYGA